MSLYPDLIARLESGATWLSDKPDEHPESTLRALWWTAAGHPRSTVLAAASPLPDLDDSQTVALRALVEQRCAGVPLAYLTGRQHFLGCEMHAAPGALIPRRETEVVGRAGLALIHEVIARQGQARVIDVCTGSGNLALAYAHHEPAASVLAADLSEDAITVALTNAAVMGLTGRVDFRTGDLLAPFGPDLDGTVDVISCNPPYISSAKVPAMHPEIANHEPSLAFDGGPFGVRILTRFIKEALRLVRPGGWICFEVGLGQGPAMAGRLTATGAYDLVREYPDDAGAVRALAARVKEASC